MRDIQGRRGITDFSLVCDSTNNTGEVIDRNEFIADIFIKPGYKFKIVDILLTNFHLPKSSLMLLVSAFAGFEKIQALYKHAIQDKYRFFSYGDVSLLFKNE